MLSAETPRMASISPHYRFIAVMHKRNDKFTISTKNLEDYFVPKKDINISEEFLDSHMRGVGYKKTATDYIFKRIN